MASSRAAEDRRTAGPSRCPVCAADLRFLRTASRPDYESQAHRIRLVDLFCGGGGLSLGVAEAARRCDRGTDVVLAVEQDGAAADVYALNFPQAHLARADVCSIIDGSIGARATPREQRVRGELGSVDVLVAGPPCQGHSDLNNHTRRDDPRNALYLRAARAAEILMPTFLLVENVPAVKHDAGDVVGVATAALEQVGYSVASGVLDLTRFGVPQKRRRHILLASRRDDLDPGVVLDAASPCSAHEPRTVAWAIEDLLPTESDDGWDAAGKPTPTNLERMRWLLDNDAYDLPNPRRPACHHGSHSYVSMYGRLRWSAPAQTITTGFGSMGQGRFVHPGRPRTLTPHEAARLQTLPDFFDPDFAKSRSAWAMVIGNAVPPLLGVHVVEPLLHALAAREAGRHELLGGATADLDGKRPRRSNGTPAASSDAIRVRMEQTKRRDTGPELALRSELHRLGYRFRVDRRLEGTRRRADIVFPRERVAVYVDGCFWHGCPLHGTVPKQNREWWQAKLDANRKRDDETNDQLRAVGWEVLRFWEHEDPAAAARRVGAVVVSRRAAARV